MTGIGFFAPLPLAMMLPFMAGQSMLMGDAFGKSYQYGKRKISSLSNEEFNKLRPEDLANDIQADFAALIPSLAVAMKKSTEFQSLIIQEMGTILKSLPKEFKEFVTGPFPEINIPAPAIVPGGGQSLSDPIAKLVAEAILSLSKGITLNIAGGIPQAFASPTIPNTTIPTTPSGINKETIEIIREGPEELSQDRILRESTTWEGYRQKGGLLLREAWNIAKGNKQFTSGELTLFSEVDAIIQPAYIKVNEILAGPTGTRRVGQSVIKEDNKQIKDNQTRQDAIAAHEANYKRQDGAAKSASRKAAIDTAHKLAKGLIAWATWRMLYNWP